MRLRDCLKWASFYVQRSLSMLVARHVVDHKQDYQAQDQQMQPQPHLGAATAPVTILIPLGSRNYLFSETDAAMLVIS